MTGRLGAPLEVKVRSAEGGHVVELSGDLLVTNRDAVREAIDRIFEEGGKTVVVDAAKLTHLDTASMALLVRLSRTCRETGGQLIIAALPAAFLTLARELRLEQELSFTDSVERALESDGA